MSDPATLGCVDCHMPAVERPLVEGGTPRLARQHLWRGGHDAEMVRKALDVRLERAPGGLGRYRATLTNLGAAHYVPTGTPDRHFVLSVRLLDGRGKVLAQEERVIKRIGYQNQEPVSHEVFHRRLPVRRGHGREDKT